MLNKFKYLLALRLLLIFILFSSIFLLFHLAKLGLWSPDDPYYHAKHSALIAQTGNLTLVKPWLEFHFFNYAPVDPWWGYHLLVAAFIKAFGLILGVKICASVLAGLFFAVFYWVVYKLDIKQPFIWTSLLFAASSFLEYRLAIERPFLLAMILLPFAAYLFIKKRYYWIFFLSIFFILLYNLGLLMIFMAAIFVLADFYHSRKVNLKPLIAASAGNLIGIGLHPHSLNYIFILFVHFWEILYLKFTGVDLGIGSEVQPTSFSSFVSSSAIILLGFMIAVALFSSFKKLRADVASVYLFLVSVFWFLVALLVPRGADFWLPFAWLFVAWVFERFRQFEEFRLMKSFLVKKINLRIVGVFLLGGLIVLTGYNLLQLYDYIYKTNHGLDRDINYQQVGDYLIKHTAPGEVVFYNEWGLWPRMFFFDDYNHYIAGVDPTFLYEYDQRLFWLWSNISSKGLACDQPGDCQKTPIRQQQAMIKPVISETFRAKYLVVANDKTSELIKLLNNRQQDFEKILTNDSLLVYRIK